MSQHRLVPCTALGRCDIWPAASRYLYCLQLRQDIKERRVLLDPGSGPALQLAALTVQGHLGEYDPEQHGEGYTHKYLEFLYGNEGDIVRLCSGHVAAV